MKIINKNKKFLIGFLIGVGGASMLWNSPPKLKIASPNLRPTEAIETLFSKNKINLLNEPVLGSKNAPITIVEFSDFECPYCKRFHDQVLPQIKENYIDKEIVRFVHKDFPLGFHAFAKSAAAAARCSSSIGLNYWDSYSKLFKSQGGIPWLKPQNIVLESSNTKNNLKLKKCMESEEVLSSIEKNIEEANAENINGTPTFIIGLSEDNIHSGEIIIGAMPYALFKNKIEKLLNDI